jgi:hypothetical protein
MDIQMLSYSPLNGRNPVDGRVMRPGQCALVTSGSPAALVFLLIELASNSGPSITNASEAVLLAVRAAYPGSVTQPSQFFEAYEYRMRETAGCDDPVDPEVCRIVPPGGSWVPATVGEKHALLPLFRAWAQRAGIGTPKPA